MASTYSTNLAIELIGTGDQAGTWGTTTNSNLGTLIEQSISGYVTQAVSTGTDTTITIPNGSTGVARNMYIELTGTGGSNTNLVVPANKKLYFIFNNSTGAVTVKVSAQTGVSVPTGKKMVLVSNGTDIVNGLNYIADFATNSFTVTNLTASSGTITNLLATSGSITNLVSSDASATVLRAGSATLTHLSATSATITNLTLTSLVISNLSIASANITTLTSASATITNLLATSLAVSSIATFAAGSAAAPSITTTGDTNTGLFFPAADTIAFTEGGVESMRIDSSGNVGIGTASPVGKLDVSGGTSDSQLYLAGRSDSASLVNVSNIYARNQNGSGFNGCRIKFDVSSTSGEMMFWTATGGTLAEKMRLDTSGNLGIGTASPTEKLHVAGALRVTGSQTTAGTGVYLDQTSGTGGVSVYGPDNSTQGTFRIYTATANGGTGSTKLTLDTSGNLGLGVVPSAWISSYRAFTLGYSSNGMFSGGNIQLGLTQNAFLDSGVSWRYTTSNPASQYIQLSGAHQWYTAASGTAGDAISFTQAMTLTADGNLGLGTTSPETFSLSGHHFEIDGRNGDYSFIHNRTTNVRSFYAVNDVADLAALFTYTNHPLTFGTNNTERARITAAGDLLVGTTTVGGQQGFSVSPNVSSGAAQVIFDRANTAANSAIFLFKNAGTQVGFIQYDNTTTQYGTSSDRRLKDNIAPADNAGSIIDTIQVVKHDWKVGGHTRYGMIAQDLHSVAPEAVLVGDADDVEDFKNSWGVDYSKLVPMLVKELQSLRKRVAELESK